MTQFYSIIWYFPINNQLVISIPKVFTICKKTVRSLVSK